MKTTLRTTVNIISLFLLFTFSIPLLAQMSDEYITVSGVVKDKKSKKKIEYVSVSVPGTNIGTVTNTDGEFSIKIKNITQAKTIEISHIGYLNYILPIENRDLSDLTIFLTANSNELSEVVIHPNHPRSIVEAAIRRIDDNYSNNPNMLSGFYRETVRKGRNYINITEAVLDIYKTSYREDARGDKVQIFKGRKLLSPKPNDTLIVKLIGGPNLSVNVDIVKNQKDNVLLNLETINYYTYQMEDMVTIDERPHYVINFTPSVILPYALFSGKYYIDKQTLAFSRAEFTMDMSDRRKATEAILVKKPPKLHFKPEEMSFTVTYKQKDGRSHLNYIRSDIQFKCDWKKKFFFFSTNYAVVSEMVVTDRNEQDITKISNKEAFKQNQVLSDKVNNFADKNFWEGFNIIEPTESLELAVNKLRKKYE